MNETVAEAVNEHITEMTKFLANNNGTQVTNESVVLGKNNDDNIKTLH